MRAPAIVGQKTVRTLRGLCLLGLLAFIGACAGWRPEQPSSRAELLAEMGYVAGQAIDTIPNYRLSGWRYLDSVSIVLHGGVRQQYLVVLSLPCPELRWSETLATTTTINLLTTFDSVLARGPGGGPLKRCPIEALYQLDAI